MPKYRVEVEYRDDGASFASMAGANPQHRCEFVTVEAEDRLDLAEVVGALFNRPERRYQGLIRIGNVEEVEVDKQVKVNEITVYKMGEHRKCEKVTLWAVHQGDTDVSSGYPAYWFNNQTAAEAVAKGSGWYGGDAPVREYEAIRVPACVTQSGSDEYYVTDPYIDLNGDRAAAEEAARQRALAKLTLEERQLLGLEDDDGHSA